MTLSGVKRLITPSTLHETLILQNNINFNYLMIFSKFKVHMPHYLITRTTSCGVLMSPNEPNMGLRAFSSVRGSPPDVPCNKHKIQRLSFTSSKRLEYSSYTKSLKSELEDGLRISHRLRINKAKQIDKFFKMLVS